MQIAFEKEYVEFRPLWKPMHLQPVFSSCTAYLNGKSEELFTTGLCLPSGSNISDKDLQRIINVIIRCLCRWFFLTKWDNHINKIVYNLKYMPE